MRWRAVEDTTDDTIAVPRDHASGRRAELLSEDGSQREIIASGPQVRAAEDGSGVVVQRVQPRFDRSPKGDVLILDTELDFPEWSGLDQTSSGRPTQHVLIRVEVHGSPHGSTERACRATSWATV